MASNHQTVSQHAEPARASPRWLGSFKADYQRILVEPWSPFVGGILLVIASALLMVSGLFWGMFGGLKLWGDYFSQLIGLGPLLGLPDTLDNPFMHRISLLNMALILGAFCAALLSRQFHINRPPPLEVLWGALGGSLMGIGAALAGGCTIGGFFTPLLFSSASGWAMWAGLLLGAVAGLKLLLWTMEHIQWGTAPPRTGAPSPLRRYYPWIGAALFVAALWWASHWFLSDDTRIAARAMVIAAGFALGFILHRSRFCMARAFREPFMTGEGDMTAAVILALAVGIPLSAVLLHRQLVDPYVAIPATFWFGSLVGGFIFGIGMIFAGGCATGAMWRLAEGHIKLLVALFFFSWVGSMASNLLRLADITKVDLDIDFLDGVAEITQLGFQAYMPDLLAGWPWALLISLGVLLVWYLFTRYNESTEKFTLF